MQGGGKNTAFLLINIQTFFFKQIICSQKYYRNMDDLGPKFLGKPLALGISSIIFIIYLILLIPLYLKRRSNEKHDQPKQFMGFHHIPKSLESLFMNFGIISLNVLVWITLDLMNR